MIFLIVYSRIHHAYLVGYRQRKPSFSNGTYCAVDILVHPPNPSCQKIKPPDWVVIFFGGSGWIRTTSVVRQQIYSLPRLSNSGARPELYFRPSLPSGENPWPATRSLWRRVVRAAGIEPAFQAWKACILAFVLCPQ